jgi:hypothetical protein
MPDISSDLDFQEKIKKFTPEGQFLAEQIYELQKNCPTCIAEANKRTGHAIGIGGISGIVGGAIVYVIQYLATHKIA